ncbi:MAG: hypothetical protein KFB97_07630 [Cyanobium sp. M30B3]|jgi:ABC-type branched-subunit amino acid transport system ATPase component|nr:MAG: hypothetical protein KFB97_07630 [Cyanobium sp. M30B3]
MRFTWAQHQHAAHTISQVQQQNSGTALALMGIALLLLLQDLESPD